MSETGNSNTPNEETNKPKKKKGKLFLIVGLVVFLIAGGAGGYYFWSKSRATDEKAESKTKDKTDSKKNSGEAENSDSSETDLPDDANVKQVVELQPFIVNLSDVESARYLRMSVSLGIGDEGEEKPDPLFLTRVKNAMLTVLTTKKSEDVLSVEGKTKLRQELLKAAQAASEKPHVEAIYITDFIVQL